MANCISNIDISDVKNHLIYSGVFNGVDLMFYESVLNEVKSGCLTTKSDMDLSKKKRVISVLSDMKHGRKTVFLPLVFKTHCCQVDVDFFEDTKFIYFCPKCESSVNAHQDYMPMGLLAHKKIRKLRYQLHICLDNLLSNNMISKAKSYSLLAEKLDKKQVDTHIGNVSCIYEAVDYYHAIQCIKSELTYS